MELNELDELDNISNQTEEHLKIYQFVSKSDNGSEESPKNLSENGNQVKPNLTDVSMVKYYFLSYIELYNFDIVEESFK